MKQYRLRITWSNGHSFYAQDKEDLWSDMKDLMSLKCIILIDYKYINLEHVRSIELEECIHEDEDDTHGEIDLDKEMTELAGISPQSDKF